MDLWQADLYDENSRLQQTIAQNFLDLLQNQLEDTRLDALLLDVGCGNGQMTRSIVDTYPKLHILGIDASNDMIEFANHHYGNSQVAFRVDKAEELKSIQSESIDAIVSFSCLHWVMDQHAAFQRMYDVLRPGGWIGLMFPADTGFDDPIDHAYAQAIHMKPWESYFNTPTKQVDWNIVEPKTIKKQLEEIGFQVVLMKVQNFDYYFDHSTAFQNWILACFQQLKLLPIDLRDSCSQHIADLYLKATSHRQPLNDQCIYQVDALMLMAIKTSL